jgi:fumarylacetoacetase
VRAFLQEFLASPAGGRLPGGCVHTVEAVEMLLPFTPADYVDFYASEHHATNVGKIFRPDQAPLLPNWHHLPIGYHGRSSTLVASGTPIVRPKGLLPTAPGAAPQFGACRRLDIEAEIGYVVGGSAPHGEVTLEQADDFVFGLVLVNDWSARDIQAFEYVPLGPFLGKSFATSVGAWVVPLEALDAARTATPERVQQLAPYLDDSASAPWGFDLSLAVEIDSQTVSRPPFAQMYFSGAQMLAHMSVNGAAIGVGDFFASGTVSGPDKDQFGSLLELTWGGKEPLLLADGRQMTFLEDGQNVTITATAPGPNGSIIDFGAVTGRIAPATPAP